MSFEFGSITFKPAKCIGLGRINTPPEYLLEWVILGSTTSPSNVRLYSSREYVAGVVIAPEATTPSSRASC